VVRVGKHVRYAHHKLFADSFGYLCTLALDLARTKSLISAVLQPYSWL